MFKKLSIIFILFLLAGCNSYETTNYPAASTSEPTPTETIYKEVIGTYLTEMIDKQDNRVNNVKLACDSINGQIIAPNEEFSFNEVVGKRTEERGYKEASIIIDGEKEKGIGGGICQVSSTLYQAAVQAGLEITERHEHSKKVPYIDKGKDATISGDLDLKIKNNQNYPVKFLVDTDGSIVTVDIYKGQ